MKASDLKIGNYVLVKPSTMLIKVAAVHQKKVAYHAVTHKLNWVRECLLMPATITFEILKKNGFTEHEAGGMVFVNDLERILWDDDGFTVVVSLYTDTHFEGHCKELHRLQNILRLCGIKKELEL